MFSFLSSVSVSAPLVCVCTHVCACDMYASLHACEGTGELHGLTCLFLLLSMLSFEADALTESGTLYFGKDGWPRSPQDLLVSSAKLWVTSIHHHSWLFTWVLGIQTQVIMSHLLSPNLLFNVSIYSLIILYPRSWSYSSPPKTPTFFPYPLNFMFFFLKNKQTKYLHRKENNGVWFVLTN